MLFLRKQVVPKLTEREIKENIIVLDTSALQSNNGMAEVEKADKVIILTSVIQEMDKYKKAGGNFGNNIAKVSIESRRDQFGEKYISEPGYEFYNHTDDNIIHYCINNDGTIVTSDNILCLKAKAFHIPYKFIELTDADNYFKESSSLVEITGTEYSDGKLWLHEKLDSRINFLYRDKRCLTRSKSELQIGDIVYQLKYKENGFYFTVIKYKIEALDPKNHARYMARIKINSSNLEELEEFGLPKEVKAKGYSILKPSEEGKEEAYSKKRELIYQVRRVARLNKYNQADILVVRGEKVLDLNEYDEGDFIYVLKYMRQGMMVYRYLLLSDLVYNAKWKISYINEIYGNGFGEEVEEEVRKRFLQNC